MWHNLRQLVRYRGLIQSLVARELKARYRGSVLGFFWSFVNPLLLLTVYSFVFIYVLPQRLPGVLPDPNAVPDPTKVKIDHYALFMFCGILPWTWFSTALSDATGSLISGGNLIKKVLFPAEILPIVSVLANLMHFLFGLSIVAGFLLYYRLAPDAADLLWFPVVVFVQLLFTVGLSLLLSALTVHFRDIRDILSNVLTFWFFATPIIYYIGDAPGAQMGWTKRVLDANPMTHIIVSYQEILYFDGPIGHWKWLLAVGAGSTVLFVLGYWVFDRLRDSFAEAI
jgi:lipopolysaccharide transport system permease protein